MAIFEYLHLALSTPPIGPLDSSRLEPEIGRGEFLRQLFSERIDFFNNGTQFAFAPAPSPTLPAYLLAGFVGKQTSEMENAGPDRLFALTPHRRWHAAFLAVDLSPDNTKGSHD